MKKHVVTSDELRLILWLHMTGRENEFKQIVLEPLHGQAHTHRHAHRDRHIHTHTHRDRHIHTPPTHTPVNVLFRKAYILKCYKN